VLDMVRVEVEVIGHMAAIFKDLYIYMTLNKQLSIQALSIQQYNGNLI
jgi:hypothetical protein